MSDYGAMEARVRQLEAHQAEIVDHVAAGMGLSGDELKAHFDALASKLGIETHTDAAPIAQAAEGATTEAHQAEAVAQTAETEAHAAEAHAEHAEATAEADASEQEADELNAEELATLTQH